MGCVSRLIFKNKICTAKLSLSVQDTDNGTIQLLTMPRTLKIIERKTIASENNNSDNNY